MKTKAWQNALILLGLVIIVSSASGQSRVWVGPTVPYNGLAPAQTSAPKPRDPLRQIGDLVYQIGGEDRSNGWVRFYGKVVGVQSGGIRVEGSFTGFDHGYEDGADFFVANFPYEVAEGDTVGFDAKNGLMFAKLDGVYNYTTVMGGSRTIKRLDYGQIYTPPPPTAEEIAAKKAAEEKKKKAGLESTIKWLREQAEAGDAFSQYRLGERYLKGDGVETNATIARQYLTKASAQGNQDARDLLQKMNESMANKN